MTTLELARKLDQCLAAQVKLQKERDTAIAALRDCELVLSEMHNDGWKVAPSALRKARAALAQVSA